MQKFEGEGFSVTLEDTGNRIVFKGALRLATASAYKPISDLLTGVAESGPANFTIDLRGLTRMNSRFFGVLARFVLAAKKRGGMQVVLHGSDDNFWQPQTLATLRKLWPEMQVKIGG